jgi:hypothetical protein
MYPPDSGGGEARHRGERNAAAEARGGDRNEEDCEVIRAKERDLNKQHSPEQLKSEFGHVSSRFGWRRNAASRRAQ